MNKKHFIKVITIAVLLVMGAGFGFLVGKAGMASSKDVSPGQAIAFLLFLIPLFFFVIGVHEAGHAITGTWMKFDFRMYVVGPFMWDKEESGWKFKWNKNVNLSGGLVICLPTTTDNLSRRFSIYALGGPAASFILSAFAYGVKLWMSAINTNDNNVLNLSASLFGLMSLLSIVIFILTMIPLHSGGFYTDGARALRFLRGGDTSRFEILLMTIITSSSGGIRPRLLNKNEINESLFLARKLSAPMEVYLLYYLYQFAFDQDDFSNAEKYLNEYIARRESIPKGIRGSVFLDAAFFYAYARRDLASAESYWKQYVPSTIIPKSQALAAEAALLFVKEDYTAMRDKIEMALKELPNMIDRGIGICLREKLNLMNGVAELKMTNALSSLRQVEEQFPEEKKTNLT